MGVNLLTPYLPKMAPARTKNINESGMMTETIL